MVDTTLMSDQPMELAPSPSLLQLVKLRSKRTKTARKPVTLENVDIQKAGEIFASLLSSFILKQKDSKTPLHL